MKNLDSLLLELNELDSCEVLEFNGGSTPEKKYFGNRNSIIGVASRFIDGFLEAFGVEITS